MKIQSPGEYRRQFERPAGRLGATAEAHRSALDIRKFEIELYWRRTAYFWTLIAAAFAAFFTFAASAGIPSRRTFLIACIGSVLSVAWYLVNRGSKYWQENWERHVDVLEDEVVGPLYKTTLAHTELKWRNLAGGYPYSVSKINQVASLYIAVIWIGIAVLAFPELSFQGDVMSWATWSFAALTVWVLGFLLWRAHSRKDDEPRVVNFRRSKLSKSTS